MTMDDLISKQLDEARARGEFDNLPGAGKPLQLSNDRMVPAEYRLAYRIMRDHDVLPDWIAQSKLIDEELLRAKQKLQRAQRAFQQSQKALSDKRDIRSVQARFGAEDRWKAAQQAFRDTVAEINRKINTYNLKIPASHLSRDLLNAEKELTKLT